MENIDALIKKYQLKEFSINLTKINYEQSLIIKNEVENCTETNINDQINKSLVNQTCSECYRVSTTPVNTDKEVKYCDVCFIEYSEKKKLYDHIKKSMLDSYFRCEVCNVSILRDNIIVDFNTDWDKREKCNVVFYFETIINLKY